MDILERVRRSFPGSKVKASTFDAFVGPLAKATSPGLPNPLQLPVITAEVGTSGQVIHIYIYIYMQFSNMTV